MTATTAPVAGTRRPSRGRTPGATIRGALIDAAARVLERDGRAALTVRAVAAEAGVAPMGVYNHLGGMDRLLGEVVTAGWRALADAVGRQQTLIAAGRAYRSFALDHRELYVLMSVESPAIAPGPGTQAALPTALNRLVVGCQSNGRVRPGPADVITRCLWSLWHGAVALEIAGGRQRESGDAAYDMMLVMMSEGLRR